MSKFDSLNDTFNTDDGVEVDAIVKAEDTEIQKSQTRAENVEKDYDYTRGNLYSLIEKGQEAINGIMEVAGETASPRAYEVAGQLIGQVAQTVDKLQDLQKKLKDLKQIPNKTSANIKNALFVGSTAELQKMLNRKKEDEIIEGESGQPKEDNTRDK